MAHHHCVTIGRCGKHGSGTNIAVRARAILDKDRLTEGVLDFGRDDTRKAEFFEKPAAPHFVMWWIEAVHIPTLEEAKERLDRLTAYGPSEDAFGWAEAPSAKLWQDKRCA